MIEIKKEFVLRGQRYRISVEEVLRKIKGVEPKGTTARNRFFVVLDGKEYPVKQVLAVVTGLPEISFTTQDAFRILRALGFEIKEK